MLLLEPGDGLDGCRKVTRLVLAVREPEQRFVLVAFPRVGCRGLQLLDGSFPLLVSDVVLGAFEPRRL
jgi:hypothetical protein